MRLVAEAQVEQVRSPAARGQGRRHPLLTSPSAQPIDHPARRGSSSSPTSRPSSLERVVSVLVIACPHALGLAIPLVVATVDRDRRLTTASWYATGTLSKTRAGWMWCSSTRPAR